MEANSSANGGSRHFAIRDCGNSNNSNAANCSTTPFLVEGGAPTNSLYVDDKGRLGLRTSTPVVEIHTKDGNTPTLRLEQDGSLGFVPQTWDVAGNESNFFIRDATNGSTLPFRIRPGAPSNAINIAGSVGSGDPGDVGLGTDSPDAELHVKGTNTEDSFLLLGNSTSQCAFSVGYAGAGAGNNEGAIVYDATTCAQGLGQHHRWNVGGLTVLTVKSNIIEVGGFAGTGDVNLSVIGSITVDGGVVHPDYVFEPGYELESIEEHAAYMWEKSHLPAVGKGQERLNVMQTTYGMLEELEKAHIYIERLNERLQGKETEVTELAQRLARLEGLLGAGVARADD